MNMVDCFKKEFANRSMGVLEDFIGYAIKHKITNITLNISQLRLITKITQVFNYYLKFLVTFNTPDTPDKGIVCNQEIYANKSKYLQKRYRSGV